jgi:hypothetical protein
LLVKPTPRNVNLGNGRFAMFNKEWDISGRLLSCPLIVDPLPSPVGANGSDACVELGLNSYS